jgi:DNA modification methylase
MKPVPYYDEAGITIYHGDCAQVLPFLDPVDLLLTDPPYGIGAARKGRGGKRNGNAAAASKDYGDSDWDDRTPAPWVLESAMSAARLQVIFGGNYFGLPPAKGWLVWDKNNGENNYADAELAWTNIDTPVRLMKWTWHGMIQENMGAAKEARVHPTQKPLAVMSWAIRLAGDVSTILDPFMGSGTTLVAAKNMGKRAIGIEREEKYCEIAVRRLAQQSLFQYEQSNAELTSPQGEGGKLRGNDKPK